MVKRWIKAGNLHVVHRGVYAVGHTLLGREGRWMAAVLACGESAALSHGPAGQLYGFVDARERLALHVSVSGRSHLTIPGIVVHRPRLLLPADTTRRLNIPTTTATRTIYDLAATLPPSPTRRAFAKAERSHLPLPAVNVPLLGYEVDFLWPAARFVVEADGADHLDPAQRDRDNARGITLGLTRSGAVSQGRVRRCGLLAVSRAMTQS